MRCIAALSLSLWCMLAPVDLNAQEQIENRKGRAFIDSLLNIGEKGRAQEELKLQLDYYFEQGLLDSLPPYVKLVGSRVLADGNWNQALRQAEAFVQKIQDTEDQVVLKNTYLELANLYDDKGDPETAYQKALLALEIATQIKDPKKADLEGVHYNLGTKAFNMGDISLSKKHQLKNLALRLRSKDENHEMYYYTYNTMGRLMWYSGQSDSAMYYFNEAIASAKKLDTTPWNQYFRPALLKGNIAVLLQANGEVEEAIQVTEEAVEQLQTFDRLSLNEGDKLSALKQKLASIDNLGVYYNSIGEYDRAEQLIWYSFNEKKRQLDPDDINITISLIILGQAQIGTQKYQEAEAHLRAALKRLNASKNPNIVYLAFCQTTLASLYETLGDYENAALYFQRGEDTFRSTMNGDYTKDFLDELSDMALFHSKHGDPQKAIALADEIVAFVAQGSFEGSLQHYSMLLAQAEVHFNLGDHAKAAELSTSGLAFLERISNVTSRQDSIQIGFRKPRNLLLKAKSSYHLTQSKNENFYLETIGLLKEALPVLEQRKSVLKSFEDLSGLMLENQEVFDYLAQLYAEAYHLTQNKAYLHDLLSIHESSIYSKIRTRLNFKEMSFANMPETVLQREKRLKKELQESLSAMAENGPTVFFERNQRWDAFTDSLKTLYPDYYNLRYASVAESLDDLSTLVDPETTLVRYFHVNDELQVYVANTQGEQLYQLPQKDITSAILTLSNFEQEDAQTFQALKELYDHLWQPIAKQVRTVKVVIFPDAELFNLSFELLTPQRITNYYELASGSLLSRHEISYNYSLALLSKRQKVVDFEEDFIAFAPEFDDDMKANYQMAIRDSLHLDQSYLTLLPQPFSSEIAQKFGKRFDGRSYLNADASKQLFTRNADEHKIIHIGTHAESNNISPELSRLVFAKNVSDSLHINDNYLYTYEIYNQNLSSNLAILTACETGKPTYQPGEGMISLAHAFNYAGSESILTSLWQIDEQSSNRILDYFYTNLEQGLSKDEALRQAKLSYLKVAEGRTAHPQYWAGLVLMGDTTPIALSSSTPWYWWVIGIAGLLGAGYVLRKRKTSTS